MKIRDLKTLITDTPTVICDPCRQLPAATHETNAPGWINVIQNGVKTKVYYGDRHIGHVGSD